MSQVTTWEEATETLLGVSSLTRSVSVDGCSQHQLQSLVDACRMAQGALDGLLTRVGLAARSPENDVVVSPGVLLRDRERSVGAPTVRRDASRVEVAEELSVFTTAAANGDISGDKLDSLARAARRLKPGDRRKLNTPELADAAINLSADQFDLRVKAAAERAKADHGLSDAVTARNNSEFRHWFDARSGMGKFSGQLDPERYEILHTAIDDATAALARQADQATSKDANLAASALVSLVGGGNDVRRPGRPLVTLVADVDTVMTGPHPNSIRQTANGSSVPPETIHRHLCDAQLRSIVLDELGVPVNVGRKYRTATDAQWVAIKALYSSCAWDGCDRPISWCQLHHIHEWERGGPTDLCNLIPLCSHHHHQVHEGRWSIKMLPDRALKIYQPDGVLSSTVDPPTRRPPPLVGQDGETGEPEP